MIKKLPTDTVWCMMLMLSKHVLSIFYQLYYHYYYYFHFYFFNVFESYNRYAVALQTYDRSS